MTSTSTLRSWWKPWECNPSKFVKVVFPGTEPYQGLSVADASAPVWRAAAQIMATEPYLFRESDGGTYVCRNIAGSSNKSLHSYGIALDLNPSQNPQRAPLKTDMPDSFIARMEGIRASGKQALTWGGRWDKPDAMHYQIDVAPADCDEVTWDSGDGGTMTWKKPGDPIKNVADADLALAYQGSFLTPGPTQGQASYNPTSDAELNDRVWTVLGRIADWAMQINERLIKGGL